MTPRKYGVVRAKPATKASLSMGFAMGVLYGLEAHGYLVLACAIGAVLAMAFLVRRTRD